MKKVITHNSLKSALLVLGWMVLTLTFAENVKAQDIKLMVVANAKGSPKEFTQKELKSVFMGERQRWSDGTKLEVVLMDYYSLVGTATAQKLYDKTSDQLSNFWLKKVFSGKSNPPKVFTDLNELQEFISKHPGAIGIIQFSEESVNKPVLVDGKTNF